MPITLQSIAQQALHAPNTNIETLLAKSGFDAKEIATTLRAEVLAQKAELEAAIGKLAPQTRAAFLQAFEAAGTQVISRETVAADALHQLEGAANLETYGNVIAQLLADHQRRFQKTLAAIRAVHAAMHNDDNVLSDFDMNDESTIIGKQE